MYIFVLICDIFIPIIMISIGSLYIINSSKRIDTILDLIVPIAMFISGASESYKTHEEKDVKVLENKKCGVIWICGGLFMLIVTILALILKKAENASIPLLEIECMLIVITFITIECFFKKAINKKSN